MNAIQASLILAYAILSLFVFLKGFYESSKRKNAYGETPYLFWMGIFVWGDAVIFGLFWFLISFLSLLFIDWLLFLLFISVFWVVRSLGETFYWISQQFSTINRNPPEKLRGFRFFKNNSVWFIYQIIWQCIAIVSIITTIFLADEWLKIIKKSF